MADTGVSCALLPCVPVVCDYGSDVNRQTFIFSLHFVEFHLPPLSIQYSKLVQESSLLKLRRKERETDLVPGAGRMALGIRDWIEVEGIVAPAVPCHKPWAVRTPASSDNIGTAFDPVCERQQY